MEIQWEEPKKPGLARDLTPPPVDVTKTVVLDELTKSPGKWAKLSTHASRNAAAQSKRRLKSRHPYHEFRTGSQDDGRVALYAMYPGGA